MRPEGWENPFVESFRDIPIIDEETLITDRDLIYEAGADAMLEGLKKECFYSGKFNDMPHDAMLPLWDKKGYLVFIEEKR